MRISSVFFSLCCYVLVKASVTTYSQIPYFYATAVASASNPGGTVTSNPSVPRAYDTTPLNAPSLPNSLPPTQYSIQVPSNQASIAGLSIPIPGDFLGFSIEMSVVTQVIGLNASFISVPFLNLMATLVERGGGVQIRVGGNTQDFATFVDSTPNGTIIEKQNQALINNPTQTPPVLFTDGMFYLMANVSALTNVKWYLGIPFNDSSNFRLQIAEHGDRILGKNILGYQVANEPDLYAAHNHRAASYGPWDYFGEFGNLVNAVNADANILTKNDLIIPNLAGVWTPESVWDTNILSTYGSSISVISVEHYPADNCLAIYGSNGDVVNYQAEFSSYLNHTSGTAIIAPYLNTSNIAQSIGKPFMMFETNTASCGGFPGISNSFGAALWGIDYALQMAYSNFSGALFHVGGRNVFYNPFTPPPTNETGFRKWTIGPLFYANVVSAEIFGTSGTARIIDMHANGGNIYTPAYAIYENNAVSKFAILNYLDDQSGASNSLVNITLSDTTVPSQVRVKYLSAKSVSTIGNISWAGQTFGSVFESDGRLAGHETIQTVACDQGSNTCQIQVPAPGFALVFMGTNSGAGSVSTMTFSTSTYTRTENTATVGQDVLATSNGQSGKDRKNLGSTSLQSKPNGSYSLMVGKDGLATIVSVILGLIFGGFGGLW